MDFRELVVVAPLIFAIHNVEEAPRMAAWSASTPVRMVPRVGNGQFVLAVSLLTLLVVAVAAWAWLRPESRAATLTIVVVQAAIAFNAIVPHLALFLRTRGYNPGLVSAALLVLPFSWVFFREAAAAHVVEGRTLIVAFLAAPPVMVALARGALAVGGRILPPAPPRRP